MLLSFPKSKCDFLSRQKNFPRAKFHGGFFFARKFLLGLVNGLARDVNFRQCQILRHETKSRLGMFFTCCRKFCVSNNLRGVLDRSRRLLDKLRQSFQMHIELRVSHASVKQFKGLPSCYNIKPKCFDKISEPNYFFRPRPVRIRRRFRS